MHLVNVALGCITQFTPRSVFIIIDRVIDPPDEDMFEDMDDVRSDFTDPVSVELGACCASAGTSSIGAFDTNGSQGVAELLACSVSANDIHEYASSEFARALNVLPPFLNGVT